MAAARNLKKPSVFREHILPVLFIFLIPGFAAWFFPYAERGTDREVLREIEAEVAAEKGTAEEKAHILAFYRTVPMSQIMASSNPKLAHLQEAFQPTAWRYGTFRWMARLAWFCLGTVGATLVIVGLSVVYSLRSQAAQYRALRWGWPVLRTASAILVLGQAMLAVALSFWVTAVFTERYYLKLIGIVAVFGVIAVLALWAAIFARVDSRCPVDGEEVSEADAPSLWARVREMAGRLQTAPPDHIVAGIEPNFFVTENPVLLGEKTKEGRTLYVSLPMLKVMTADEADAVLGHELAHFSGDDTFWGRKIGPLIGKFAIYREVLRQGPAMMVASFMDLFWKLYQLSIHRLSRVREFRADRVGADLVSPDAMKRALIKITSYSEYRGETEEGIIKSLRLERELDLPGRLQQGYPAFLGEFATSKEAIDERVPHPFDSHPTLHSRLAELGFEAEESLRDPAIQQAVPNSWYESIATAPELEARLWSEREELLQLVQTSDLAGRMMPANEEEVAALQEHYPDIVFRRKDGSTATLTYNSIHLSEWADPIRFADITDFRCKESFFREQVILHHQDAGPESSRQTRFFPGAYSSQLLTLFLQYHSRHQIAEEAN